MAIENNTVVSIEYEVKEAQSGEVVDSNKGGAPLEFIVGQGQIIPGLEKHILDMSEGESKSVEVPAEEAYGPYNEEAIQPHDKEQFAGIDLEEGMTLYGQSEQGQTVQVTVKSIDGDQVTIDYNHPLAGKALAFDLTVSSARAATEEELQSGVVGGSSCCGGGGEACCGEHK